MDSRESEPATGSRSRNPIIELRGVRRHFSAGGASVRAIDGIDLRVEKGEFVTITGASGSGKSTLLNLIGLLDTPTAGSVVIRGWTAHELSPRKRSAIRMLEIGFIFQFFNLQKNLTALENVMVPYWLAGHQRQESEQRAIELLERVGLSDRMHHLPSELSGGQQQRVAIARALVNRPSVLLADEPTGNLDSRTTAGIIHLFRELNRIGQTILLVTHEHEITESGNRILELRDGKIVGDHRRTIP